jgi:DNA modification methylase
MGANMEYNDFIESKTKKIKESGFDIDISFLNNKLFDFQKHIVKIALKKGKYAIFADCGLGKTAMQLEWAFNVVLHTNKPVLILCPLAVAGQTIKEGEKFNILVTKYTNQNQAGIYITNYEQLDNIDCSIFSGVVLDESSILKNLSGYYRNLIINNFFKTNFKLACTATPSPNEELEIGNHSEFLNVLSSRDMKSIFFVTDKEIIKTKNKYRLKKHSQKYFYEWISSWSIMLSNPNDIGFKSKGYQLPKLNYIEKKIITNKRENNLLFNETSVSAMTFNKELRLTMDQRIKIVCDIVNNSTENFIVWVNLNEESEKLKKLIPDSIEIKGSDKKDYKEKYLLGFSNNEFRVLITKPEIAQYGLNYQNCSNQIFASLDFSFEGLYQSIRRSYRFGQKKEVNIFLITVDTMQNIMTIIEEKNNKFIKLQKEMLLSMNKEIKEITKEENIKINKDNFNLILGDCVEEMKKLDDDSIGYSFSSPPFGALYVFSDNPKDMSNVKNNDEFLKQYEYMIKEMYRVLQPGRLVSIHIMQATTLLGRDGFYSIVDFRGDLIRLYQKIGFIFHAENMIRKDPKTAAIRTKNHQLMHGTTKRDSAIVRPGLADYILTFRKPGENKNPIKNNIPFELWCKIAEPVWLDINESDTLEYRSAKSEKDERHLTPTQLTPIEYCYLIWSKENDTILCPFMGIGSEGYVALKMKRKFIGIELKKDYFDLAVKNITNISKEVNLF